MTRTLFGNLGFTIHLIVYGLVNLLLITINLTGSSDGLWFHWPLLGWGIGLLAHGIRVWRTPRLKPPTESYRW